MSDGLEKWDEIRLGPVAILGAGISGKGASALLSKLGWEHKIYDEQKRAFTSEEARACSFVICSPGFRSSHPWRKEAFKYGKKLVSETDFASTFTDSKIIAITGTNGKTTLTSFLCHLWGCANKQSVVAGNIGVPLSQVVADGKEINSTIFLEVSSFQAEDLNYLKPESVLWSNFADDHLDFHSSKESYFYAKSNLLDRVQDGTVLVGESVKRYADKISYSIPEQSQVIRRSKLKSFIEKKDHFLSSYPQQENMALAYAFAHLNGISRKVFDHAISSYSPEPHRLEKLDTVGKAIFWNDSKATNFSSTLSACMNFNEPLFWIGGGRKKGGMFKGFAEKIKPLIKKAFLIGETRETLAKELSSLGIPNVICNSLEQAVSKAFSEVKQKTHILFSPAFASFDSFKNYIERGNCFVNLVLDLKEASTMSSHNT